MDPQEKLTDPAPTYLMYMIRKAIPETVLRQWANKLIVLAAVV